MSISRLHPGDVPSGIYFCKAYLMIYPTRGKNFSYAHIIGRTVGEEWPELPLDVVWDIFSQELSQLPKYGGTQINAFVLMRNHFHLLMTEEISKITDSCKLLAKRVSGGFECVTGQPQKVFDSVPDQLMISDFKHLRQVYRYIYRNPVKAGITEKAENYRFSTLAPVLGIETDLPVIPVKDTFGLIYNPIRLLQWINESDQDWLGPYVH
jgi:putative transposase